MYYRINFTEWSTHTKVNNITMYYTKGKAFVYIFCLELHKEDNIALFHVFLKL